MFYSRCLLSREFLRNQGEVFTAAATLERTTRRHAIRRRWHLYPGIAPLSPFVDAGSPVQSDAPRQPWAPVQRLPAERRRPARPGTLREVVAG